jgi:hypothetical protein
MCIFRFVSCRFLPTISTLQVDCTCKSWDVEFAATMFVVRAPRFDTKFQLMYSIMLLEEQCAITVCFVELWWDIVTVLCFCYHRVFATAVLRAFTGLIAAWSVTLPCARSKTMCLMRVCSISMDPMMQIVGTIVVRMCMPRHLFTCGIWVTF